MISWYIMILYINHLLMWIFFHGHWNALRSCAASLSRRSMCQRPYHTFHRCSKCCGQCTNAEGLSGSSLSGSWWKQMSILLCFLFFLGWTNHFELILVLADQVFDPWPVVFVPNMEGGPPIYVKTMWFYMFLFIGMEWLEWDSVV